MLQVSDFLALNLITMDEALSSVLRLALIGMVFWVASRPFQTTEEKVASFFKMIWWFIFSVLEWLFSGLVALVQWLKG